MNREDERLSPVCANAIHAPVTRRVHIYIYIIPLENEEVKI